MVVSEGSPYLSRFLKKLQTTYQVTGPFLVEQFNEFTQCSYQQSAVIGKCSFANIDDLINLEIPPSGTPFHLGPTMYGMIFSRSLKGFPSIQPCAISLSTPGLSNFVNTPLLMCWVNKGQARSRAFDSSTIERRSSVFD